MNNPAHPPTPQTPPPVSGLRVRSDLRAGAWRCSDCQGKVTGSQLFQPTCSYCVQA